MDFDLILDHLGHFGKFQFSVMILCCIAQILGGMQMHSSIFLTPMDKVGLNAFRCHVPECDNESTHYLESFVHFAIPTTTDYNGTFLSSCERFSSIGVDGHCEPQAFNWSSVVPCNKYVWDHAEYEFMSTSEFDIICKKKKGWNGATSNSIFMYGILFGSAGFGMIADKFGRKNVMLSATTAMVASSIFTTIAPNFGIFSTLRFISAAAVTGLFQTGFILAVEFIGTSKRLLCANFMQIVFAMGELVLSLLAYFIRKWRFLQLAISIPSFIMLIYFWLLPESVRWLNAKGRHSDARKTVLKAARWNKTAVPEHLLRAAEYSNEGPEFEQQQQSSGPLSLMKSPQLRKLSMNIFFSWIVNAMVYYGLTLSTKHLTGSPYANLAILTAAEIPAVLLATWALGYFGRRYVLCVVMVFGGVACILTLFIPQALAWLSLLLAVLGKCAIGASFAIIYIYSAEIYPTELRSTGIGFSSMFARIGGIVAPLIAQLRKVYSPIPMIIFGAASIVSGLLALYLPETNNRQLPESIEETLSFSSLQDIGYERFLNRPRHLPNMNSMSPRALRQNIDESRRLLDC